MEFTTFNPDTKETKIYTLWSDIPLEEYDHVVTIYTNSFDNIFLRFKNLYMLVITSHGAIDFNFNEFALMYYVKVRLPYDLYKLICGKYMIMRFPIGNLLNFTIPPDIEYLSITDVNYKLGSRKPHSTLLSNNSEFIISKLPKILKHLVVLGVNSKILFDNLPPSLNKLTLFLTTKVHMRYDIDDFLTELKDWFETNTKLPYGCILEINVKNI